MSCGSLPKLLAISILAGRRDRWPILGRAAGRGPDVRGRLIELDAQNVQVARSLARDGVEVVQADAAGTDAYIGAAPADLLLLCGIFGNISDEDVERTARAVPQLCEPGATVVWTDRVA